MDGAKPDVEDVVDATDPLAGLVEKTAADPGAPFAPEILASLADLRKADRAAFESPAGRTQAHRLPCHRAR